MKSPTEKLALFKEILFYSLGVLLILGFVVLYFPRFLGIPMLPPAIRFLVSLHFPKFLDAGFLPTSLRYFLYANWAVISAIAVNAGMFILFLAFLPYREKVEWRSKGAFAAFILALMAEMFGIPLLLFILSPLASFPYTAQAPGGWLNNPLIFDWPGAVTGVWLTLVGMLIVMAGWHQVHRDQGLVTTGLYHYIRHPQYTGFFLIMTGWLLHWETTLTLLMYPILLVMYTLLARREENDLLKLFSAEYEIYRRATPMFLPFRLPVRRTTGSA